MPIIIYFASLFVLHGQNNSVVDSLQRALKIQNNDTIKVNTLNELAWELKKTDALNALNYANLAFKLSDSLNYEKGKTTSLNRLGTIEIYQKEYNKAEKLYLQVLSLETKTKNVYGIGRAQNQLSEIYREKKDLKKALQFGLNALSNFETLHNKKNVALIANNIGLIYQNQGEYHSSMNYLLKSLKIREELNETKNIGFNYLNLGILSIAMHNYPKGIYYLSKSETIFKNLNDDYELAKIYNNLGIAYFESKNYETSLKYYNKSIGLKKELKIEEKDAAYYNNIGAIYYKKGNLNLALNNYLKSIEIQSQNVDDDKWLDSYCNIGHIYYVKKEYNKALNFYLQAIESSKKSKKKIDLLGVLNNVSRCYSELKQFDLAYKYSTMHNELRDSIEFDYKKAVNLKEKYEQQKKDKEIAEKDKKIALIKVEKLEAESKKKSYFIYSLISGLLLVTLLFFALFKGNKLKQKHFLAQKDIEIERQKVEELLKKQELKSINAMIEGQEGERKRIARDLHDRLGGILSMVKIHFKSVEDNLEALKVSNLKQYEKANELLDDACEEVRKISHDMISGVLSKFGLVAALEDLKETLEQSKRIEVEFVTHGLINRLESDVEIAVYRIIQELINNTLKYANATEISIQLLKGKNGLNVIVEDNGIGFDTTKEVNGIGLKNIDSRVSTLDGELNIDSIIGKGTTVTIDIPLKEV